MLIDIFDGWVELTLSEGDRSGCDFVINEVDRLSILSIVGTWLYCFQDEMVLL